MPVNRNVSMKAVSPAEIILTMLVFTVCATGAALLPIDLCPDEGGRRLVSDWIFNMGTLPTGNEMETIILNDDGPSWGFSYALRPYLSAIISAFFVGVASWFSSSELVMLVASRMPSILSITAVCIFCLGIGRRLFVHRASALLLAAFVCLLPQVAFLGMYQNNDSLALAAVAAMLFFLVKGYDTTWNIRSCVGLGVAFSVGLLSYYSIYGWILAAVLFCVAAVALEDRISNKARFVLKRAALIGGFCLVLAGWFFVRNAMLHQGDFLGLASEETSRAWIASQGIELQPYDARRDEGLTPWQFLSDAQFYWLWMTSISFVGVFGYMDVLLPDLLYQLYGAVFLLGIVLFAVAAVRGKLNQKEKLLLAMMVLAAAITFTLHFWQSYSRDYQPQGRYIISIVLLFGYLLATGVDCLKWGWNVTAKADMQEEPRHIVNPASVLICLWVCLFACSAGTTMSRMLA